MIGRANFGLFSISINWEQSLVVEVGGLAWDDLDEKNLNEKMKKAALQGGRLLEKIIEAAYYHFCPRE